MGTIDELKKQGFKILNLRGHPDNFEAVKKGELTVIEKEISFRTQPKFLTLDDKGEVVPRKYDFLNLISGKEKLIVAVEKAEWFVLTDDEDNPITHKDMINGKQVTWTECQIQYTIKLLSN